MVSCSQWRFGLPTSSRFSLPIWTALASAVSAALVLGAMTLMHRLDLEAAFAGATLVVAASTLIGWIGASSIRQYEDATSPRRTDELNREPPYAAMVDALPDPVLLVTGLEPDDPTGRRYVLANQAAREVLNLTQETGMLVTAIRDPDVLEAVDEALFGQVAATALYDLGGTQGRVLKAFAQPLGGGDGELRTAVLVLRDETDIRRAERTRADFLANASHELRTPLASLSGFIETLRGHARTDDAAREKFLGIMQTQAERMSRLIDDLLSLSRIELNEHIAPAGAMDLALAVMDVLDSLGPLAREGGVTLKSDIPAIGQAITIGDRDQLVQVIQNLVDNALKYTPPEGVVTISLRMDLSAVEAVVPAMEDSARLSLLTPDHGTTRYLVLQVTDSGPGLAREHLPRLTERFYRVEGQKSGARPGTGLGLAIVKHIINRHRGGLAVESVEGRGARFTAYVPMASQPALPVL